MQLLKILLLSLLLAESDGRLMMKLESSSSSSSVEMKTKLKLVADLIAGRPGENIVIVADIGHIEKFASLDVGFRYVTLIETGKITNQTVEALRRVHLKDNKPCFYIILPTQKDTDADIKRLISTVKEDSYGKVSVVYPATVNVKDLYRDL